MAPEKVFGKRGPTVGNSNPVSARPAITGARAANRTGFMASPEKKVLDAHDSRVEGLRKEMRQMTFSVATSEATELNARETVNKLAKEHNLQPWHKLELVQHVNEQLARGQVDAQKLNQQLLEKVRRQFDMNKQGIDVV